MHFPEAREAKSNIWGRWGSQPQGCSFSQQFNFNQARAVADGLSTVNLTPDLDGPLVPIEAQQSVVRSPTAPGCGLASGAGWARGSAAR